MLDRTLPYIGVIMVRPEQPLPAMPRLDAPFRLVRFEPGREADWAAIETSVGEFGDPEAALDRFRQEFLPHPDELARRCLFIVDETDQVVATATAWTGNLFGRLRQPRLHWVSVRPGCQGRGLGGLVVAAALATFGELGDAGPIYLTTQTWSYVAIRIYRRFGFEPYLGPQPAGWKSSPAGFASDQELAWRLIEQRIGSLRPSG